MCLSVLTHLVIQWLVGLTRPLNIFERNTSSGSFCKTTLPCQWSPPHCRECTADADLEGIIEGGEYCLFGIMQVHTIKPVFAAADHLILSWHKCNPGGEWSYQSAAHPLDALHLRHREWKGGWHHDTRPHLWWQVRAPDRLLTGFHPCDELSSVRRWNKEYNLQSMTFWFVMEVLWEELRASYWFFMSQNWTQLRILGMLRLFEYLSQISARLESTFDINKRSILCRLLIVRISFMSHVEFDGCKRAWSQHNKAKCEWSQRLISQGASLKIMCLPWSGILKEVLLIRGKTVWKGWMSWNKLLQCKYGVKVCLVLQAACDFHVQYACGWEEAWQDHGCYSTCCPSGFSSLVQNAKPHFMDRMQSSIDTTCANLRSVWIQICHAEKVTLGSCCASLGR